MSLVRLTFGDIVGDWWWSFGRGWLATWSAITWLGFTQSGFFSLVFLFFFSIPLFPHYLSSFPHISPSILHLTPDEDRSFCRNIAFLYFNFAFFSCCMTRSNQYIMPPLQQSNFHRQSKHLIKIKWTKNDFGNIKECFHEKRKVENWLYEGHVFVIISMT